MVNKTTARSIALWIFREATRCSESGSWITYDFEIEEEYKIEITEEDRQLIADTLKELFYDWAIIEIMIDKESIDIQLADNYIEAEMKGENE